MQPYRTRDDEGVLRFELVFRSLPTIQWIAPSLWVADQAAKLRAAYRPGIADAILAATVLNYGATGLVTNDRDLLRIPDIDVLLLDDVAAE